MASLSNTGVPCTWDRLASCEFVCDPMPSGPEDAFALELIGAYFEPVGRVEVELQLVTGGPCSKLRCFERHLASL